MTTPGHEEEGGEAIHERKRGEGVEAGAEPGVLHQHGRSPPREPSARGQSDRNVFARRRNIRQARMALEGSDQILDQRAGHAGEEVESAPLEKLGELRPGHSHSSKSSAACRAGADFWDLTGGGLGVLMEVTEVEAPASVVPSTPGR